MNCPHCKDTGDTGSGYLDCFYCDAAQIIAAHEARKAFTVTADDDCSAVAQIWDAAKGEAAMYVENHCVDGEMHANVILNSKRPTIRKITPAAAPAQPQWISVKDRLPELIDSYPQYKSNGDLRARSEAVLVCGSLWDEVDEKLETIYSLADLRRSWDKDKNDWAVSWNCSNEDFWYSDELVKYWMPLPAAPIVTPEKPE